MKHGKSGTLVNHKPTCMCGETGKYNDRYDAYYCPISFDWLEFKCSLDSCPFCINRPESAKE